MNPIRSFRLALGFLTRLPAAPADPTEREVGRSALYFPLVGILIGALALGGLLAFDRVFPPLVSRLLVIVVTVLLSGAFHLDGLADAADGFYAGRSREDVLRIMKDPHIGTMGVVAVVCVLLLKVATICSLSEFDVRGAFLAFPVIGRWAMVNGLALPYARSSGLGKAFADHRHAADLVVACLFALGASFGALRIPGLLAVGAAVITTAALLAYSRWRIGGVTGDVCGAAGEIAETAFLLGLLATRRWMP